MKKIFFILAAIAAMVSCSKADVNTDTYNGDFSNLVPVELEFGGLCVDEGVVTTRMVDNISGDTHTFSWEAGDKISMILHTATVSSGLPQNAQVFNCSSNFFSANKTGNTSSFTGMLPRGDIEAMFGTSDKVGIWAIYPAVSLNVADEMTNDYGYNNYNITGPSIPSVQDGTGLKYCYFVSSASKFDLKYFTMSSGPSPFYLSHSLVKFKTESESEIVKVEIKGGTSELSGDLTYYQGRYYLQTGCLGTSLTIENNGQALNDELYFACRRFKKDDSITFTFTASDNTKSVRTYKPSAEFHRGIFDLGTVTLDNWTPAE